MGDFGKAVGDFFSFVFGVAITIGIVSYITYNKVIPLLENCKTWEANVQTQLKRKLDVYFKFSEMLQKGSSYESSVFTEIAKLRTNTSLSIDEKINQAHSLMAVAEANPNIHSIEMYKIYQFEIADTETKVQQARQSLNYAINEYNSIIKLFPTNIICKKILKLSPYHYQDF